MLIRDTQFDEDACLTRTGNAPFNRASLNNIAMAVVFANRRAGEGIVTVARRFQLYRREAIQAICGPREPSVA